MLMNFIHVAVGGALGAMSRYGVGLIASRIVTSTIPVGVITVNLIGSFLMGFFAIYAIKKGLSPLSPLVMTGFLGGFTTFSAFSLETVTLYEQGHIAAALAYIFISVIGALLALTLGIALARGVV